MRKTLQGALAEQRAALRRTASRAEEESFWERFQASATPAPRAPHPMTRAMGHAAAAAAAGGGQREKVAVTGATGFVGVRLVEMLQAAGYDVVALTRDPLRARSRLPDGVDAVASADWARAMRGCCAVINLAGEPISTRWSEPIKREIKASRVRATRRVAEAIQALGDEAPPVLVSASAIGYYGTSNAESGFDEAAPSGGDYLAEVCREWEAEAQQAGAQRTVVVRVGVVLDSGGGALAKMMPVFQLGAGGPLGSGSQWFSWIHRDDLCALLVESVRNGAYSGVLNATAPRPVRMGELCAALGRATGRPSWLPVPSFAIEALLGEGATVVLEGQRVLPAAAESKGFKFRYTDIDGALEAIARRGI